MYAQQLMNNANEIISERDYIISEAREQAVVEAKKEKEAKALFLNDMREILGDDKAEISDKVHYKDGKFIVRVEILSITISPSAS